MLTLRAVEDGVEFLIRAQPRASRNAIAGLHDGRLRVAVTAPPVGGKANQAVVAVLAKAFDVRPSAVRIVAGKASRLKTVRIGGLASKEARRRVASLLARVQSRSRTE